MTANRSIAFIYLFRKRKMTCSFRLDQYSSYIGSNQCPHNSKLWSTAQWQQANPWNIYSSSSHRS